MKTANFVLQLRFDRLAQGLSIAELARRSRTNPGDLSLIERGLHVAYPEWRRRISVAMRLPQKRLFMPAAVDAE